MSLSKTSPMVSMIYSRTCLDHICFGPETYALLFVCYVCTSMEGAASQR
jgi:hypothetical protein